MPVGPGGHFADVAPIVGFGMRDDLFLMVPEGIASTSVGRRCGGRIERDLLVRHFRDTSKEAQSQSKEKKVQEVTRHEPRRLKPGSATANR